MPSVSTWGGIETPNDTQLPGKDHCNVLRAEVETSVISMPAVSSPVPEAKYLANLSVLEPARKVEPVSTFSDFGSQSTN